MSHFLYLTYKTDFIDKEFLRKVIKVIVKAKISLQ